MTPIQKEMNLMRNLRLAIIVLSVITIISLISITLNAFAWGIDESVYIFIILYPTLLVSLILVLAKTEVGYLLTLVVCVSYAVLLTNDVAEYLVFDFNNYVLFWVLLLPYSSVLIIISLTITSLTFRMKNRWIRPTRIALPLCFLIYPTVDRYNKDYSDNIFIDAEIKNEVEITLNCKPSFADSRTFVLSTNSKKLGEQIKAHGEFYQGSYFLSNTSIIKNFQFDKLKSITVKSLGNYKLTPELTWTVDEMNGDFDFLRP